MEVRAKLRYLRMSPRKVRLVVDLVRRLPVDQAVHQLQFMVKGAARPVLKLLNSAIANAENNFKLDRGTLYIKRITVDQGPHLKRWHPRAFGRAAEILKRSSHITVILDEATPSNKNKQAPGQPKKKPATPATAKTAATKRKAAASKKTKSSTSKK